MQPAELNLMEFSTHTRNSPLPGCHLLDDGSVTSTKHEDIKYIIFKNLLTCTGLQNAGKVVTFGATFCTD